MKVQLALTVLCPIGGAIPALRFIGPLAPNLSDFHFQISVTTLPTHTSELLKVLTHTHAHAHTIAEVGYSLRTMTLQCNFDQ